MPSQAQNVDSIVSVTPSEDTWTSPLLPGPTATPSYVEPDKFQSPHGEGRTTFSRETKALAKSSVRLLEIHPCCVLDLTDSQAPLVLAFLLQYSMTFTALVNTLP